MNISFQSVFSLIFVCGISLSFNVAEAQVQVREQAHSVMADSLKQEVKIERLIETSNAWDGSSLPAYPQTQPVITINKYTFPPHSVTNLHFHKIINCGVILSGTLTVVGEDGTSKFFHAGDPIVETVGTIHHGENRGDEDVVVLMFYAGDGITPLSFPADNQSK